MAKLSTDPTIKAYELMSLSQRKRLFETTKKNFPNMKDMTFEEFNKNLPANKLEFFRT